MGRRSLSLEKTPAKDGLFNLARRRFITACLEWRGAISELFKIKLVDQLLVVAVFDPYFTIVSYRLEHATIETEAVGYLGTMCPCHIQVSQQYTRIIFGAVNLASSSPYSSSSFWDGAQGQSSLNCCISELSLLWLHNESSDMSTLDWLWQPVTSWNTHGTGMTASEYTASS